MSCDIFSAFFNLFLNLSFLSNGNYLERSLELFSLLDKGVRLNNFLVDFLSDISDLLSSLLDGRLNQSNLRDHCL